MSRTESAPPADGSAKILVGGGSKTGDVAVSLRGLDTTNGIVQNNRVRVVVQNIPYNNGGAVTGPVTVQDGVVALSGNSASANLSHGDVNATSTITLLPPQAGAGGSQSSTSPSSAPSAATQSAGQDHGSGGGSADCRSVVNLRTWPGGYLGTITVLNSGPALAPWSVTFAVSPGTRIYSGWNAAMNRVGSTVTAKALGRNRSLATGQEINIGFVAAGTSGMPPGNVQLDGKACVSDTGSITLGTTQASFR